MKNIYFVFLQVQQPETEPKTDTSMNAFQQTGTSTSAAGTSFEDESSSSPSCQTEMDCSNESSTLTIMSFKAWVILDEITQNHENKNLDELVVKDIIPAICRHKSVELNCTPRLVDEITVYASGLLSEFKTAKSTGGQSARCFKAKINEQTWRCKVTSVEFVTQEDFERIVKEEADYQDEMRETKKEKDSDEPAVDNKDEIGLDTTYILVSGALVIEHGKTSYRNTSKSIPDLALDVLNASCQSKLAQMKHKEVFLEKEKEFIARAMSRMLTRLKKANARGGSNFKEERRKFMVKTYKIKVHACDFIRIEDFQRTCMEFEQHELETKLTSNTQQSHHRKKKCDKKMVEFEDLENEDEDEDNVSAKDWPELVTGMLFELEHWYKMLI